MKKRTKKLLILCSWAVPACAQAQLLSVQMLGPERDFGYLVGDVLRLETVVTVARGTTLDRQSLPVPGPLNAAIELRSIGAEQSEQGDTSQIRIEAEYQSFFAPERVTETELPGFTIHLKAGSKILAAQIPAFSFRVSPLRVVQQTAFDLTALRPDHAVQPLPERSILVRLMGSLAVALAAALVLANNRGWLPGWRGTEGPFTIAARRIARLSKTDDAGADIYRHMHRAFDATAGHHVFPGDLPDFIDAHPRFAPAQAEIAVFFARSEARFFARNGEPEKQPANPLKLARTLRRLERRR